MGASSFSGAAGGDDEWTVGAVRPPSPPTGTARPLASGEAGAFEGCVGSPSNFASALLCSTAASTVCFKGSPFLSETTLSCTVSHRLAAFGFAKLNMAHAAAGTAGEASTETTDPSSKNRKVRGGSLREGRYTSVTRQLTKL